MLKQVSRDLYAAMHQFGKLKLGDLIPEMTKSDCMTMMSIHYFSKEKGENLTISELAEKIKVQPPAISRTLKALEEKGYVERIINKSDRRNTYVVLTEEGQKELKSIQKTMDAFAEAVVSRMNEEDMQKMIVGLNEFYQIAQEEIELRSKKERK